MEKIIKPAKRLLGEITVPGDKSISHRALIIGAIARGVTEVKGLANADDCNYTAAAFREMGIAIETKGAATVIKGRGLRGLKKPSGPIYAGNSGTTMRLLCGVLAGQRFQATLTGGEGIAIRPMGRVVEPLSMMGVDIKARDGEYPPLVINGGRVKPVIYKTPVASAQIKSAILFSGLYANGATKVTEPYKSRDHTERMLKYFGANIKVALKSVSLKGGKELTPRSFTIPGDISSASFFIAGALLLKGSSVRINNVSINPTRAGILKIVGKMGGRITLVNKKKAFEPVSDMIIESGPTHGIVIGKDMIPSIIDELPVIFVLAALSKGRTVIKGAAELRVKETDRIASMQGNLKSMGADFLVKDDEIVIEGVKGLRPGRLKSFQDHRTCMAMAIAALAADGESVIEGAESVSKSFPNFFNTLFNLTTI